MNSSSIKRYAYIDALRGYAILAVVLTHSTWVSPTADIISIIAGQGARGVQLFFIASALTIFLSMESRNGAEKQPLMSFFIRRFFRIAPLFYVWMVIYLLQRGLAPQFWAPNGIRGWDILITAIFLNGWHPETINSVVPGGWSIAVEMTFYLCVPYLFRKLQTINSTAAALLGSIILSRISAFVIVHLLQPLYPESQKYIVGPFSSLWFFSQLPVFLLGILLYHLVKKYPAQDKTTGMLFFGVSVFLMAAFLTTETFFNLLPEHFLYGLAFLFLGLALHFWPNALFVNRPITLIGKLSFSIYSVHFLVIDLLRNWLVTSGIVLEGNLGFTLAYLLVLVISIGISWVTYHLIEIPGINLGKRIIERLSSVAPASSSPKC